MRNIAQNISEMCGMCGMPCGIKCGTKSLIYIACAAWTVSILLTSCVPVRACACMRTPACTRLHTAHTAHTAHAPIHAGLRDFAYRTTYPTYRTKKNMGCQSNTRTIRCTEDNLSDFKKMVREWPELHSLVKGLQAQGYFPGLRAMQITLTGSAEYLAKGIDAIHQENASSALKSTIEETDPCK